jgi:hypothetical protein
MLFNDGAMARNATCKHEKEKKTEKEKKKNKAEEHQRAAPATAGHIVEHNALTLFGQSVKQKRPPEKNELL